MGRCKACGERVSIFVKRIDGLCPKCSQASQAAQREEMIQRLGRPPIECSWLLPALAWRSSWARCSALGDLCVTPNGLVFVSYAPIQRSSLPGPLLATLAGGPVLGVVVGVWKSVAAGAPYAIAEKERQKLVGVPLEDRLRMRTGSVIVKGDIMDIQADPQQEVITLATCDGQVILVVENGAEVDAYLRHWLSGGVETRADPYGVNLRIGRPKQVVQKLLRSPPNAALSRERLARAGQSDKYIDGLALHLMQKRRTQALRVASCLGATSGDTAQALVGGVRRELRYFRWSNCFFACFLLFFAVVWAEGRTKR